MECKNFFEIFKRYQPDPEIRALLSRAERVRLTRYDPATLVVEVDLFYTRHEDPFLFYVAEEECRELYGTQVFRILPHFSPEAFSMEYFNEIITEASMCGGFTKGFFNDATFEEVEGDIVCHLPFASRGIEFVEQSNTVQILKNILFSL